MDSPLRDMDKEKAFVNLRHNLVHLWFPNGNGLSMAWGPGSYTDNYDYSLKKKGMAIAEAYQTFLGSDTTEVMILNAPEKLENKIEKKLGREDDSVLGMLSMEEWLYVVKELSK